MNLAIPKMKKSPDQPSSKTLNVGVPTFFGVRRLAAAFATTDFAARASFAGKYKPSEITLDVGAPTFLVESLVAADLQVGSFWGPAFLLDPSLKTGHYKTFAAVAQ